MPSGKSHGDRSAFKPGDIISNSDGTQVPLRWSPGTLTALFEDFAVSYWLKQAVRDLTRRDPLDALRDVELLQALMLDRLEACLRAEAAPQPQDGCSR